MKKNSQKRKASGRPAPARAVPAQTAKLAPSQSYARSSASETEAHKTPISNTPADSIGEALEPHSNKFVAIYIAILAVLVAIGAVGGNDALKTGTQKNILWADAWAHYQGKSTRQTEYKLQRNQLRIMLDSNPSMPDEAKKSIQTRIAQYEKAISCYDTYTSDCRSSDDGSAKPAGEAQGAEPKPGSEAANQEALNKAGKRELTVIANKYAEERDAAYAQHPYFDYSQALLQIAIVLASSSIILGGRRMLMLSGAVACGGVLLLLNGFLMFANFLGD